MDHKKRARLTSELLKKGVRVTPEYDNLQNDWKMIVQELQEAGVWKTVKKGKVSVAQGKTLKVKDCIDMWDKTLEWAHKTFRNVDTQGEALQGERKGE